MTRDPHSATRRRIAWLLLAAAVLGAIGYSFYRRATERSRVIDAIVAAGGKHQQPPSQALLDRVFNRLFRERGAADSVLLDGAQFDDVWLAAQHDLRSLEVRGLMLRNTRLSREAVLRLVARHSLDYLGAPGIPLTDADTELLASQEHLTRLVLMQSELTDAGLSALEPARLQALSVAGTHITAAGLQAELSTATKLQYLMLDGRQFTPELAGELSQLKSLNMIALIGPDVTDAHVKLLESMPNLRYIRLEDTSVSAEAEAAMCAARPVPVVIDVAPPAEVFFKWRTEPTGTPSPPAPRSTHTP